MNLATLLVLGSSLLPAADDPALIADDLRFAENLALHRFFDLATGVVRDARGRAVKAGGDQTALEGEASLVEARVWRRVSENTADEAQQLAAQSKAIELLEDWSRPGSSFAYLDRMVDALEDLAGLYHDRALSHAARLEAGDAAARAQAEADFERSDKTWRAVQKEAEDRVKEYEQADKADAAQRMGLRALNTLYFRGLNSIDWAEVSPEANRDLRLDQAIEQLGDFTWDVPDDQIIYYQALYEQARAYYRLGEVGAAKDLLNSVLETFAPAWEDLKEYNPVVQAAVSGVFDRVWGYLARIEAEQGDMAAAEGWIAELRSSHQKAGVDPARDGMRVLLDWADRLGELGRTAEASEIIQYVVDKGRGTPEGDLAARRFAQVVKQGGATSQLSAAVLMDAAGGFAAEGDWGDAAHTYLRAAAAIASEAERREHGFPAWSGAGAALRRNKRFLEAALCYEQALALAQQLDLGLERLETAARGLYNAYGARYDETQDPFDKKLRDDASNRLLSIPGIELDLAFFKADETFSEIQAGDAAAYRACQELFASVPPSSPNYERAQVFVARCLEGAGEIEQALAAYESVERRFADPAHDPTNATARAKREIAVAQCLYYHALLLLSDAVKRPQDALALLQGYEEAVPGQVDYHHLAKLRRLEAHAQAGDAAAAEAVLAALQEAGSGPAYVASGAFKVAAALEAQARAETDAARRRGLLHRAAEAMWTYAEASGFTSFTNMLTTGEWYLEAGDPGLAQVVFAKTLDTFNKKVPQDQLDRATIGLATAYDIQGDFARARPLWIDLVDRNPTSYRVRTGAARSFGGWLELDAAGEVLEVAGSGEYERAFGLWADLQKAANVNNKYFPIWWEAKLGTIYTRYRMGAADSQKLTDARKLLDNQKLSTPDYDEATVKDLPEEHRYTQLFKPYFRYLDRQLPTR